MNQRIWTPVDTNRLLDQIQKKSTLAEISKKEKRSIPSIQSKLKEIAVDMYFNKNMSFDKIEGITGIQKESLLVKRVRVKIPANCDYLNEPESIQIPEQKQMPQAIQIPEQKQIPQQIQSTYTVRLSTENPFSIESLSNLIQSTVNICLLASKR